MRRLTIAAAVALLGQAAWAESSSRLAVLALQTTGVTAEDTARLQDTFASGTASLQGLDTMDAAKLVAALGDVRFATLEACRDSACYAENTVDLGASHLLVGHVGRLGRLGAHHVMTLKLVQLPEGKAVARSFETVEGDVAAVAQTLGAALDALLGPLVLAANETTDPIIMHAEALEAELDQETSRALDKLREANALLPTDETIAFDLARVSFEAKNPKLAQDVRPFLAMDPSTPDANLLRAYLHLAQGDEANAATYVGRVLQDRPSDPEALQLHALVGGGPARGTKGAFLSARVQTACAFDSNVTVLPETETTHVSALRTSIGGDLFGGFPLGPLKLEVGGGFQLGAHVTERTQVDQYDAASARVFVSSRYVSDAMVLSLEFNDTNVFTDLVASHFMHTYGGRLEARFLVGPVRLGLYGQGGFRDFIHGNLERVPGSKGPEDRDGPRFEGGPVVTWRSGSLSLRFHAGAQAELAEGKNQRERGGVAGLLFRWHLDPITAGMGIAYEYRDYPENLLEDTAPGAATTATAKHRVDQRLTPMVRGSWAMSKMFRLNVSYGLTRNISEDRFGYMRHLGQLGLEARW